MPGGLTEGGHIPRKKGLLCCPRMSRHDDEVMYPVEKVGHPQERGRVPWRYTGIGFRMQISECNMIGSDRVRMLLLPCTTTLGNFKFLGK